MDNLLTELSQNLQAKLKNFGVSQIYIINGELHTVSDYDMHISFYVSIEKELISKGYKINEEYSYTKTEKELIETDTYSLSYNY